MSALTLDVMPLPQLSASVIAYRQAPSARPCEPWHLDYSTIRYEAGNALTTVWRNFGLRRDSMPGYRPRTELGEKLLALRQAYIASGGQLLSADALDEELRSRRGGLSDA